MCYYTLVPAPHRCPYCPSPQGRVRAPSISVHPDPRVNPERGRREGRRGGAPLGNQNARKHGLYAQRLSLDEANALGCAPGTLYTALDFDDQVALLRLRLARLVLNPSGSLVSFARAARALGRLQRLQRRRAAALAATRPSAAAGPGAAVTSPAPPKTAVL